MPSDREKKPAPESERLASDLRATLGGLEIALDAISEALVWTGPDGKIQWCNTPLARLAGRSRGEILGRPLVDVFPLKREDTGGSMSRHPIFDALETDSSTPGTYELPRKGQSLFLEISGSRFTFESGQYGAVFVIRDVTERTLAKEKAAESQKELRDYLDHMSTMSAKVATDGTLIMLNKTAEEASGLPHDELMKTNFLEGPWWTFDPDVQARVREAFQRALANQSVNYDERVFVFGKVITINFSLSPICDAEGRVSYVIAEGRDITAQKLAEEKFRGLLEAAPDAMIIVDEEGKIVLLNKQTENVFGYRRGEMLGKRIEMLIPSRFQAAHIGHRKGYHHDPRTREMGSGLDLLALRRDGKEFPVEISLSPLRTQEGVLVTAAIRDVTERKKEQIETRRLNTQLTLTNEELEAFSYSVSHDLRMPLRSLAGFSQAVFEDYSNKLDDRGKDFLTRIRTAALRMGGLIDDLLNLSRLTRNPMKRERVDLSAIADEIAKDLQKSDPARQVEFVIQGGITAEGDPKLLWIALENLLRNSWKYTSTHDSAKIEFGMTKANGSSIYFVRDDGAGFDMTYAKKLFGAFQRLHSESEFSGTGIGLATVRRIVSRHQGRIWGEGKVDKGATFYFTLQ